MDNGFWIIIGATCALLIFFLTLCIRSRWVSSDSVEDQKSDIAKSWIPGNLIEEKLQSYREKKIARSAFISALIASEVLILTNGEGKTDPEDCDSIPRTGQLRLIPIYTSLYQLKRHLGHNDGTYSHIQIVRMRTWVPLLPARYGLIVNPEHESAVELMPEDVEQLRVELS